MSGTVNELINENLFIRFVVKNILRYIIMKVFFVFSLSQSITSQKKVLLNFRFSKKCIGCVGCANILINSANL